MLSFFPRGVLDEILNLNESVSEDFPSYSLIVLITDLAFIFTRYNLLGGRAGLTHVFYWLKRHM